MNVTWSNSLGKVAFFCFFCGIQILKVTYFSYLGKVFESLTNKSQNFRGFKKTRRFRVFVLRYRANSKSRKWRKIANLIESKAVLLRCVWNCWIRFLFERASLDVFFVSGVPVESTWPHFLFLLILLLKKPVL